MLDGAEAEAALQRMAFTFQIEIRRAAVFSFDLYEQLAVASQESPTLGNKVDLSRGPVSPSRDTAAGSDDGPLCHTRLAGNGGWRPSAVDAGQPHGTLGYSTADRGHN